MVARWVPSIAKNSLSRNAAMIAFHKALHRSPVIWLVHTCRDNHCVVMLHQFLLAAVRTNFIPIVANGSRLDVVQNHQTRHVAEVIKSMNVAQQSVFLFYVPAGLRIGVPDARQFSDKNVSRPQLPGNAVHDVSESPTQSTCMASRGLCVMRKVAFVTRTQRQYFSPNRV